MVSTFLDYLSRKVNVISLNTRIWKYLSNRNISLDRSLNTSTDPCLISEIYKTLCFCEESYLKDRLNLSPNTNALENTS